MFIDTHLHFSGCISPAFVWDVIKNYSLPFLAQSEDEVVRQMTYNAGEARTFSRFLDKFRLLDQIPWNEEILDKAIKDVSNYVCLNDIDHAFVDLSINKYMRIGWHKHEVIKFIYDRFKYYAPNKVSLILALKYEYPQSGQRIYSKLIERDDIKDLLIGIDLVGDEAYFEPKFYGEILADWVRCGKMVRAHVGESQSALNVQTAIRDIKVTNVAHGIKILGHKDIIKLALDHGILFDLCYSSNYQTGVIPFGGTHPIGKMLAEGLSVTIGSDDPIQFNTTLKREYELLRNAGIDEASILKIVYNAAGAVRRFSAY